MTAKRDPSETAHLVELYQSGLSYGAVGRRVGLSRSVVEKHVKRAGAGRPAGFTTAARHQRTGPITQELIALYMGGVSVKALAVHFGLVRSTVNAVLLDHGIKHRDRSEAMYVRMAQTSRADRSRLTAAAHQAIRGRPQKPEVMAAQATCKEHTLSKVGIGEAKFCKMLHRHGLKPRQQVAVGPYNIDIAVGSLAVEIHVQRRNPAKHAVLLKRMKYLTDCGWTILYIWITRSHPLSEVTAEDAIAFLKRIERDPTTIREYRVIRGSGEFVTAGRF